MAYDEALAARLRALLARRGGVAELKMFGGLCYMLDGKMLVGVIGADLMVRVGPESYEEALARRHARPMDFTGRPLTGFVYVAPAGYRGASLGKWVEEAAAFVATLPQPKPRKPRPRRRIGARRGARLAR
jgi:TfoX/Sxy family transcriptional regulator of competence genes